MGQVFALARYNPDGSIDPNFGSNGTLTTEFPSTRFSSASAVAVDRLNIIAAGYADFRIAVARYNYNGSLDASFGSRTGLLGRGSGKVFIPFPGVHDVGAEALAIDGDRKIVVAGTAFVDQPAGPGRPAQTRRFFILARLHMDGHLDDSFGDHGRVMTDFVSRGGANAHSVSIDSQGRIVVGGVAQRVENASTGIGADDVAVARYHADGSLDHDFNGDGKVLTNLGQALDTTGAESVAIDFNSHKIIAAGTAIDRQVFPPRYKFALVRYNVDGSVDQSFGGGKVFTDFSSVQDGGAHSVLPVAINKIVVAGTKCTGAVNGVLQNKIALARYHQDGSLDTTFGGNGKVVGNFFGTACAVARGQLNTIVVASIGGSGFELASYDQYGDLNTSFGQNGRATTSFQSATYASVHGMAIDPYTRIVLAGDATVT
jgi:uncharacterized delta-60 repeat protein